MPWLMPGFKQPRPRLRSSAWLTDTPSHSSAISSLNPLKTTLNAGNYSPLSQESHRASTNLKAVINHYFSLERTFFAEHLTLGKTVEHFLLYRLQTALNLFTRKRYILHRFIAVRWTFHQNCIVRSRFKILHPRCYFRSILYAIIKGYKLLHNLCYRR